MDIFRVMTSYPKKQKILYVFRVSTEIQFHLKKNVFYCELEGMRDLKLDRIYSIFQKKERRLLIRILDIMIGALFCSVLVSCQKQDNIQELELNATETFQLLYTDYESKEVIDILFSGFRARNSIPETWIELKAGSLQ